MHVEFIKNIPILGSLVAIDPYFETFLKDLDHLLLILLKDTAHALILLKAQSDLSRLLFLHYQRIKNKRITSKNRQEQNQSGQIKSDIENVKFYSSHHQIFLWVQPVHLLIFIFVIVVYICFWDPFIPWPINQI
jgi:hypothetical protein